MSKNEIIETKTTMLQDKIPSNLNKIALFNLMQTAKPVAELKNTEFTVLGYMTEIVEVPFNLTEDEVEARQALGEEIPMIERERMLIITDLGAFTSFSKTFNRSLSRMEKVFSDDMDKMKFTVTEQSKGKKRFYIVTAIEK